MSISRNAQSGEASNMLCTYSAPVRLQHLTVVTLFVTLTPWRGCHDLQLVHDVSGGAGGPGIFSRWLASVGFLHCLESLGCLHSQGPTL